MQIQFRIHPLKIQTAFLSVPGKQFRPVHRNRRRTIFVVVRHLCEDLTRDVCLVLRARRDVPLPIDRREQDTDECDEEAGNKRIFKKHTAHLILKTSHIHPPSREIRLFSIITESL